MTRRAVALFALLLYIAVPAAAFANLCDRMAGRAAEASSPCHQEKRAADCGHCAYLGLAGHQESPVSDAASAVLLAVSDAPAAGAATISAPAFARAARDASGPPDDPLYLLNSALRL